MKPFFEKIIRTVDPLEDTIYGNQYRCALTLKDNTHIPCAILQSRNKRLELAKRRIKETLEGNSILVGDDPYGRVVSSFVTAGNRVNDYDVIDAQPSRFAIPIDLLQNIEGETTMGWTGWVFEMGDGNRFSYGSSFSMYFFQLPESYSFSDVVKIHNHSYITEKGEIAELTRGGLPPDGYPNDDVLREMVHFVCSIDDINED